MVAGDDGECACACVGAADAEVFHLSGESKCDAGCLANAHVLFGHGFDDREVGVVVAHGSLSLAGCVNDVATDVSTITTGAGVGWKCQRCPD